MDGVQDRSGFSHRCNLLPFSLFSPSLFPLLIIPPSHFSSIFLHPPTINSLLHHDTSYHHITSYHITPCHLILIFPHLLPPTSYLLPPTSYLPTYHHLPNSTYPSTTLAHFPYRYTVHCLTLTTEFPFLTQTVQYEEN